MNTKEIIRLINENNLRPNKKLGQNFLCNPGILKRIMEYSDVKKSDNILEIGPGLGELTENLLNAAGSVTAVEIDSGLHSFLKAKFQDTSDLVLIHDDFLKAELNPIFTKVISNLPYYNSSEILFRLAEKYNINKIYVMLQKEMAERILSKPGSKSYGALTAALSLYYGSKILFNVDRQSFYPKPDISSSFVYLKRKENIGLNADEIAVFHKIVKSAFWGRRKTLRKSLAESPFLKLDKEFIYKILSELKLDNDVRGEELDLEKYKAMAKVVLPNCQ